MSTTKKCKKCGEEKLLTEFNKQSRTKDGLKNYCKICFKKINQDRYKAKRGKILDQNKKWYRDNLDKRKVYEYEYHRTPACRVMKALQQRVRDFVNKPLGGEKTIGCTRKELVSYLESKFKEGMSWDNYGKWHIDHIIPMNQFDLNNEDDFKKANHYKNLQPLWAKENYLKDKNIK